MTVGEFQLRVFDAASRSEICDHALILEWEKSRIKIRIELFIGGHIDAYFNQKTESTSDALIRDNLRVFGADNAGSWHMHPASDPEQHVPISNAVSIEQFA